MLHLCCNLTNIQIYSCDTINVNNDIKGKEQDKIITNISRYVEFVSKGYSANGLTDYGRQDAQLIRIFLDLTDIQYFKVGYKFKYNLSSMYEDIPYNPTLLDIVDCEIKEIKKFGGLNSHYEVIALTYN